MAIKVALAAALLVALLALAGATTYTTTVSTTSLDDEVNPSGQCRQQIQGTQFRACQRFMLQGGSQYREVRQQDVQECCQQLREFDGQGCACQAIRHAMRQVQQGGFSETGHSLHAYRQAMELPRMCNLMDRQCQLQVVFL